MTTFLGPADMYNFQREIADIKADDVVSRDRYPQMKIHPLANAPFLALTKAAEVAGRTTPTQAQVTQQGPGRILFEVEIISFTYTKYFR